MSPTRITWHRHANSLKLTDFLHFITNITMVSKPQDQVGIRKLFAEIEKRWPHTACVRWLQLSVGQSVFSPAYFNDTEYFAEEISKLVQWKDFLEIGTWTGAIALIAAIHGATSVTATDINPSAIKTAKENFHNHKWGEKIELYEWDLYSPLPTEAKYDVIFWNHPFNKTEEKTLSLLENAGFDYQYRSLNRYLQEAEIHLSTRGRLLLGSGSIADIDAIDKIARKYWYTRYTLARSGIVPVSSMEESLGNIPNCFYDNEFLIYEFIKNIS